MEDLRVGSSRVNARLGNVTAGFLQSSSTSDSPIGSGSSSSSSSSRGFSSPLAGVNPTSTSSSSSIPIDPSHSGPIGKFEDNMEWFAGVEEELLTYSSANLNNELDSLWTVVGSFVPPPPRPPFLPEDDIATDGLTTCDLCSWAMRNPRYPSSLPGTLEAPADIGWVLTLVIVSLVSAGIGAVFMVTLIRCRRLKSNGGRVSCCGFLLGRSSQRSTSDQDSGVMPTDRPSLELDKLPAYHEVGPATTGAANVWSWLGARRGGGPPGVVPTHPHHHHQYHHQYHHHHPHHHSHINPYPYHHRNNRPGNLPIAPVENHYTHMQTEEALYAELDSTHDGPTTTTTAMIRQQESINHYHELTPRESPRYLMSGHIRRSDRSIVDDLHHSLSNHHHHHHHEQEDEEDEEEEEQQPSYQNTAYTGSDAEPDVPTLGSAPSSAYYSDLSSSSAHPQTHHCARTIALAVNDTTLSSDYI